MKKSDLDLLAEAYEQTREGQRPGFVLKIKREFGHLYPKFGIEEEGENRGKMFAVMSVKDDEGDRYRYDTRVIYDGGGVSDGHSEEEAARLYDIAKKHPMLNK